MYDPPEIKVGDLVGGSRSGYGRVVRIHQGTYYIIMEYTVRGRKLKRPKPIQSTYVYKITRESLEIQKKYLQEQIDNYNKIMETIPIS